ncbi:MAG: hypothetical protein FJX77_09495 [Armatimonadetes bacterium]|nr:hypothetical protein [Armatimonadota bacterium]
MPTLQLEGPAFWVATGLCLVLAIGILATVHFANNQVKRAVTMFVAFLAGLFYFLEFFLPPDPEKEEVSIWFWNLTTTSGTVGNAVQVVAGFTFLLGIYNLVYIHGNNIRRRRPGWSNSVAFFVAFLAMAFFAFGRDAQNWFDPRYPWYMSPESQGQASPLYIDPKASDYRQQLQTKLWAPQWMNDVTQEVVASPDGGEPALKEHSPKQDGYTLLFQGLYRSMDATMFSILAFYIVSAAYRAFRIKSREAAVLMVTAIIVMLGQVPLGQALTNWIPIESPIAGLRLEQISQFVLGQINGPVQRAIGFGIGLGGLAMALRIWLSLERGTYFEEGN